MEENPYKAPGSEGASQEKLRFRFTIGGLIAWTVYLASVACVPWSFGLEPANVLTFITPALIVSVPFIVIGAFCKRLTLGVVVGTVAIWASVLAVIIAAMAGYIRFWMD